MVRFFFVFACVVLLLQPLVVMGQTTHNLDITRHSTVSLGNGDADNILKDGTEALKSDDDGSGTGDMACDVTLKRSGAIGTFASNSTPATINTQSDQGSVFAEASFVKVVKKINYCGKTGTFAGCALGTMIVAHPGNWRGIVWAHEYGHVAGLDDRSDPKALMTDAPLASDQTYVNQTECTAFEGGPKASAFDIAMAMVADNTDVSLIDLVRSTIVDVFPYALFATQDPAQLPAVKALLSDIAEQPNWGNAVIAVGILGAAEDVDLLVNLVRGDISDGEPDLIYQAKSAGLLALGYLLNRTGSPRAAEFLIEAAGTAVWEDAGLWLGETEGEREESAADLRETALLALALSGTDTGRSAIDALSTTPSVDDFEISPEDLEFFIELNATVAEKGLLEYYGGE